MDSFKRAQFNYDNMEPQGGNEDYHLECMAQGHHVIPDEYNDGDVCPACAKMFDDAENDPDCVLFVVQDEPEDRYEY